MHVTTYTGDLRLSGERVVALGFFDGVHVAHRRLLALARAEARRRGCELCVLTFLSEGRALKPDAERIYPTEIKQQLLREAGVDRTVLCEFSAVSDMDAATFVETVLCRTLGCVCAVCGYNFRFSRGAVADSDALYRLLAERGRACLVCEPVDFEGRPLSATFIRTLLREGDMQTAAAALGVPYRLRACPVRVLGLGRTLGTPTVNLTFPEGTCRPKNGVYRCIAAVDGVRYTALTNVGTCPTFGARPVHAECYLLDFDGDIYGKEVTVYFLAFLREERAFASADELRAQIERDVRQTVRDNPPKDTAIL